MSLSRKEVKALKQHHKDGNLWLGEPQWFHKGVP